MEFELGGGPVDLLRCETKDPSRGSARIQGLEENTTSCVGRRLCVLRLFVLERVEALYGKEAGLALMVTGRATNPRP